MKLIIAGDRNFTDWDLMNIWASDIWEMRRITEVVSGTARGADTLGEEWAENSQLPCKRFPADWDQYGKAAGHIRNKQMADYADMLLAFIAPGSRGTLNMIETMRKVGKPAVVVPVTV